jgi:FkbM family methyltransferase
MAARDVLSRMRWERRRLARLTGRYAGWLPGDPLPFGSLDCTLATNEHGVYCIPRSAAGRPVPRTILRSRVYERTTLELMMNAQADADIVHAGAFLGDFLPGLARSREHGAMVWAFEPNHESYRCSMVTVFLNDLRNVVMTNAGLSAKTGVDRLRVSGGISRVIGADAHVARSEHVTLVTVDQVVPTDRRVGVIHLDIEGHEQHALTGAMETIARCLPLILVETLVDDEWFDANLRPLGYQLGAQVNRNRVIEHSA